MRSYDRAMPEELNRVLTDHARRPAAVLLRRRRAENLRGEGVGGEVEVVGDVMVDVAQLLGPRARGAHGRCWSAFGVEPGGYLLATAHRAGNVDDPRAAARGSSRCWRRCPAPVVLPLHPRTRARLEAAGLLARLDARRHAARAAARLPRLHRAAAAARARC